MAKQISILVIAVLLHTTLFVGCNNESPANVSGISDVQTPNVDDREFHAMEARAAIYELWIARMDPYVTTNSDGTYTLDWDGFLASLQTEDHAVAKYFAGAGVISNDAKIIEGLRDGIAIANADLLQPNAKRSSDAMLPEAAGSACWRYWWGVRCCYWGTTAQQIVDSFVLGGAAWFWIPLIGAVGSLSAAALQKYVTAYGGFCVNVPWGFPLLPPWISRP
ncbi:MAG: hypothetical protein V1685_04190 [Parcubacteria group bacterium]